MYVCMYVCMHVCIYVYIHVCTLSRTLSLFLPPSLILTTNITYIGIPPCCATHCISIWWCNTTSKHCCTYSIFIDHSYPFKHGAHMEHTYVYCNNGAHMEHTYVYCNNGTHMEHIYVFLPNYFHTTIITQLYNKIIRIINNNNNDFNKNNFGY